MAQRNLGNREYVISCFHRCDSLPHRCRMGGTNCFQIRCMGFEQGQIVGFPPALLSNGGNLGFQIAAQLGERFAQGPSLLENVKRFNGQVVILTDCGSGSDNRVARPSGEYFDIGITAAKEVYQGSNLTRARTIVVNDG